MEYGMKLPGHIGWVYKDSWENYNGMIVGIEVGREMHHAVNVFNGDPFETQTQKIRLITEADLIAWAKEIAYHASVNAPIIPEEFSDWWESKIKGMK